MQTLATNGRAPSIDRLSTLPSELLHIILDFLFPTHNPHAHPSSSIPTPHPSTHPLLHLSLTGKTLYATAQAWASSFLCRNASITHYKPLTSRRKQRERNFLSARRGGLLPWLRNHCIFCGKTSARAAILMNGFRCCAACDREQWPGKITRSAAKASFGLRDVHLPTSNDRNEDSAGSSLRYGMYTSSGVVTTMYMEVEVRALAQRIHGDLDAYFRKRDEKKAERTSRKIMQENVVATVVDSVIEISSDEDTESV